MANLEGLGHAVVDDLDLVNGPSRLMTSSIFSSADFDVTLGFRHFAPRVPQLGLRDFQFVLGLHGLSSRAVLGDEAQGIVFLLPYFPKISGCGDLRSGSPRARDSV